MKDIKNTSPEEITERVKYVKEYMLARDIPMLMEYHNLKFIFDAVDYLSSQLALLKLTHPQLVPDDIVRIGKQ